jgi:hypothetical protein
LLAVAELLGMSLWFSASALAPGPALGVLAMRTLRRLPEAARIAQGKR